MHIEPRSAMTLDTLLVEPPNTTESPFLHRKRKRLLETEEEMAPRSKNKAPPEGYICRKCHVAGHFIGDCPQSNEVHRKGHSGGECWFCLSNPQVEKHLVVSIGETSYVTLAKGPLRPEYSSHLLIMPITHVATADPDTRAEMNKYLDTITNLFAEQGWKAVGWECTFKSMHLCYQVGYL